MKLLSRLKQDIATLKTLSGPRKREFIWDYYKLPIGLVLCAVALVVITLAFDFSRGDTVMYAVLINADDTGDKTVFSQVLEESGMDMAGKDVEVTANYTLLYDPTSTTDGDTVLVLAALFGIGDLDVFAANEEVFTSYADQDAFVDLSLFIEPEDLAKHDLYTCTTEDGNEIVAGIWLHEGSPLHEAGYYTGDVVIGVAANAQNLDPAVEFMKSLAANY